jgi:acetyl-CoA C-acetyltransferase
MESMTNAPYLILKGRGGYRMGHDKIYDHMMLDGLEDAYEAGRSMGTFGEDCAAKYNFSRDAQDHFAMTSVQRAKDATASGAFTAEITPVTVKDRTGERVVSIDEGPGKVKLDKVKTLKPAFKKDGTITAASSSSINDGAAALVMMRESTAKKLGCTPLARVVSHATFAQAPEWFTTAPVGATQQALARAGWQVSDVDLWEVNEAFAVVPMALMHELKVPHDIVNINGRHLAACVESQGLEKRLGHLVHWRWRRHGHGFGVDLTQQQRATVVQSRLHGYHIAVRLGQHLHQTRCAVKADGVFTALKRHLQMT